MADWPIATHARVQPAGSYSSSRGTTVNTSVTPNVMGSWTEIEGSTLMDASALLISVVGGVSNASILVDVGVGSSGAEIVVVPSLIVSSTQPGPITALVPIVVPAGSRIVARAQTMADFGVPIPCDVSVRLVQGGFPMSTGYGAVVHAYGVDSAGSRGTPVDPGATANTKGAWTELTSATVSQHSALAVGIGNASNSTAASYWFLFDVAVGPSGAEQIILPDMQVGTTANESLSPTATPFLPVDIPAGSRLAVRAACSGNNSVDRILDYVLHAI